MQKPGILTQLEQLGGKRVLRVRGALTLPNGEAFRQALMEALQPGETTFLDLSQATGVDICGLQLICSAHRTFFRAKAGFELEARPAWFKEAARHAGFYKRTLGCPFRDTAACLWEKE